MDIIGCGLFDRNLKYKLNNAWRKQLVVLCLLTFGNIVALMAQKDTLILNNGDVIAGEIKSLDKGVITIETGYSKNDFTIEWSGLKKIYSHSRFLITLKEGKRVVGSFQTIDSSNRIRIMVSPDDYDETSLDEIVYLKGLKSKFWSRIFASIDLGFSMAKANHLRQFNTSSTLGYLADKWQLDSYYRDNRSSQDSISDTKRAEAGISAKYFLPRDWFLNASVNTLSNTEQALRLRLSAKLGVGKFMVHTNKAYFGIGGGISAMKETFTNNTPKKNSEEGFLGAELNLFDIGDFSLFSSVFAYFSFTESGRFRTDFKLDAKYKFKYDFYVKSGLTFNYDNRPAIAGNETDYVLSFSVGWDFNK
jgi:hypothetical protein